MHHFKKILRGGMSPNPLAKRMASQCAACRKSNMQISISEKIMLAPPPPSAKSWERPCNYTENSYAVANEHLETAYEAVQKQNLRFIRLTMDYQQ